MFKERCELMKKEKKCHGSLFSETKASCEYDPDCIFCYKNLKKPIIAEMDSIVAIPDGYPVTPGHLLIIPKRHAKDYFDLTKTELHEIHKMIHILRKKYVNDDPSITGFNIGINCGFSAGQSIFHAHIHLIPRRDNDTKYPKGGVRGVIPGKRSYG
jgi:diadenosine tetraphosphate (Ap4A) HIT family hydrolase